MRDLRAGPQRPVARPRATRSRYPNGTRRVCDASCTRHGAPEGFARATWPARGTARRTGLLGNRVRGRPEDLLAQLLVAGQLRRIDADVLHLRRLQAALLDDLELLVARIDDRVGFLRVDDRDDRHVAIDDHEADVLVRDLAERAQPLHPLRA